MLNADQNIIKYINISMSKFNQHNKKENIKEVSELLPYSHTFLGFILDSLSSIQVNHKIQQLNNNYNLELLNILIMCSTLQ